jgi:putative membrane protein
MMDWYEGGPGWGGWILMTLMMLAFWALLIFGGAAVYRSRVRADPTRRAGDVDAQRLLDERFARGEIDAEEFTARRELLRTGSGNGGSAGGGSR